ncbi:MAG: outer membrane beta-barrel protein [Cypionkella sp.]|nr:outer membrane beta-barrel protein [Cypionkella sp.]
MIRMIAAALVASTALAGMAQAGGPTQVAPEPAVAPAPAPVVAPAADWTGGYVGAQLGYGDMGAPGTALDGDGFLGGVHAGYRMDFGQIVAGAELSYDRADIALNGGAKLDDVTRLKLTAGYDLGPALLYGAVGAVRGSVDTGAGSVSDNGWLAGVGMDYALTDQWTVGGEVLNHKFNNFGGLSDVDVTTVQARVGFRF